MDPRPTDPFDRDRLERFAPDPMLVAHYAGLSAVNRKKKTAHPEAGGHNCPHFRMMRNHIQDALRRLPRERAGSYAVVVFGAKECNDIPLDALATAGHVYLIDVDPESLEAARNSLRDAGRRERVHPVCMDASMFETELIHRAGKLLKRHALDIHRAFPAVVSLHREASEGLCDSSAGSSLPLHGRGADLVVSTMTLSQFLVGYVQLLLKSFLKQYGREDTQSFFLPNTALLQRSTLPLARGAAEAHVRELCRIVKSDGAVVLSDHALHGRGTAVSDSEVDVDPRSLVPYSKNVEEEKRLHKRRNPEAPLPDPFRVDVAGPDETFTLEGADSLKSILSREPLAEPLRDQRWWWLTQRAEKTRPDRPVWLLSYVEAHTFRTREKPVPGTEKRGHG